MFTFKMRITCAVILPLVFFCGCAPASLVDRMKIQGVTDLNTGKIVLYGSEADVGSDIKVTVVEHFLIQEIWDTIYQSRPGRIWYASGYRRADFYTDNYREKPALTLWINASDACHIDGQKQRFRCPKLNALVMKLLQYSYDRQKESKQEGGL